MSTIVNNAKTNWTPCGYRCGGYTSGAREYHYYTATTTRDDCYETLLLITFIPVDELCTLFGTRRIVFVRQRRENDFFLLFVELL